MTDEGATRLNLQAIRCCDRTSTRSRFIPLALKVTLLVGVPVSALAGMAGCQQSYDPPSLINKLRVVGVKAEPPVLGLTETTLTPLVIGAKAGAKLCHAWSLCLFALGQNGNYACLDPELETGLGTDPTATVSFAQAAPLATKMASVFEKLQIAIPKQFQPSEGGGPGLKDASGFEIFIRFKVAEAAAVDVSGVDGAGAGGAGAGGAGAGGAGAGGAGAGGAGAGGTGDACPSDALAWLAKPCVDRDTCLAGYKRLALALDVEDVHKNPEITGLELDGVAWPEDVTPTVPCYRGDDFYGQPGNGAVPIKPLWDPSSLEVIGPSPDPKQKEPLREGLLFSWLSTDGDWDKQRTFDEVPGNSFFPPDYKGQASRMVRIWVVARDGRNGTSWTSRQIEVKSVVKREANGSSNPLCRAEPTLPGCP